MMLVRHPAGFRSNAAHRLFLSIAVSGILLLMTSCSAITSRISGSEKSAENKMTAQLTIVSKGMVRPKSKKPMMQIRYIQYSLDGRLLQAHEVMKDFSKTIALTPGRHVLHVERLRRGILSARAFILDDGDCYAFTVAEDQTATFEGRALPRQQWEADGFTDIETWEQFDSHNRCRE